jgi:hypothetical protein
MDSLTLMLTGEERALLHNLLTAAVNETRIEVHRAKFSREFRKDLIHREELLRGLLERMEKVPQSVS